MAISTAELQKLGTIQNVSRNDLSTQGQTQTLRSGLGSFISGAAKKTADIAKMGYDVTKQAVSVVTSPFKAAGLIAAAPFSSDPQETVRQASEAAQVLPKTGAALIKGIGVDIPKAIGTGLGKQLAGTAVGATGLLTSDMNELGRGAELQKQGLAEIAQPAGALMTPVAPFLGGAMSSLGKSVQQGEGFPEAVGGAVVSGALSKLAFGKTSQEAFTTIGRNLPGAEDFARGGALINESLSKAKDFVNILKPKTISEKIIDTKINDLYAQAFRPSTAGKKTLGVIEKAQENRPDAFRSIAELKDNLELTSPEGDLITGQTPKTFYQHLEAIGQTKKHLYEYYTGLEKQAGGAGVVIESEPLIIKLHRNIIENPISAPEQVAAAQEIVDYISKKSQWSPSEIDKIMTYFNKKSKPFFSSGTDPIKAEIYVSANNELGRMMDEKISGLTGQEWQQFRKDYGALRSIEDDAFRAMSKETSKTGGALMGMTDIFTGSKIGAGVFRGDATMLADGLIGLGIKEAKKWIHDPSRKLQKIYGLAEESITKFPKERPIITPETKLLPAGKEGAPDFEYGVINQAAPAEEAVRLRGERLQTTGQEGSIIPGRGGQFPKFIPKYKEKLFKEAGSKEIRPPSPKDEAAPTASTTGKAVIPEKLLNPKDAEETFYKTLKEKYPNGIDVYHESSIENYESIRKNGLISNDLEGGAFGTIGQNSGFITTPEKVIVKIKVPPSQYGNIFPDMRYNPENPFGDLLSQNKNIIGADVHLDNVPREWIQEVKKIGADESATAKTTGTIVGNKVFNLKDYGNMSYEEKIKYIKPNLEIGSNASMYKRDGFNPEYAKSAIQVFKKNNIRKRMVPEIFETFKDKIDNEGFIKIYRVSDRPLSKNNISGWTTEKRVANKFMRGDLFGNDPLVGGEGRRTLYEAKVKPENIIYADKTMKRPFITRFQKEHYIMGKESIDLLREEEVIIDSFENIKLLNRETPIAKTPTKGISQAEKATKIKEKIEIKKGELAATKLIRNKKLDYPWRSDSDEILLDSIIEQPSLVDAPQKNIKIKDLKFNKDNPVEREAVKEYRQGEGRRQGEPIIIMRRDGINYIIDGHHRAKAALLDKRKTIDAIIFDAPSEEFTLESFSKAINSPKENILRFIHEEDKVKIIK